MFSFYFEIFVYTAVVMTSIVYMWHLLLKKKINFKDYKLYITLFGLTSATVINLLAINKFIKIIIICLVMILFFFYLFRKDLRKTIITPIFVQLIFMISECIYALMVVLLNFNINDTIISVTFNMISNIIISIIAILISKFKVTSKIYSKLLNITKNIGYIHLFTLCIIGMIIADILAMSAYYKIEFKYLLLFNLSMTLFLCFIIVYSFNTKHKYNKVYDKYNVAINSLKEYENMMSKYRVANHENKNLLLSIRAMIINKDKDIPNYIDTLIKEKFNDNDKLLFKMNIIPTGGLRATIYSGILKIQENKIKYKLNIDRNIKTVDLINLETSDIIDICTIIGVFIDNAIEEVNKGDDKFIGISLYVDDLKLNIKVSNNFYGLIDLNKIYDLGYTTKGQGHGYGLSMVKNIVSKNNHLSNNTEISKNIFSQILVIDYIKKSKEHLSKKI